MSKTIVLKCNFCQQKFKKELKEHTRQTLKGRTKFYCSLHCSGKNHVGYKLSEDHRQKIIECNKGNQYGKKGNFTKLLRSSRQKRHSELTEEFLQQLWDKQTGKCAISGVKLEKAQYSKKKSPWTVSIDRIDSSKPYTQDNVQLVAYSMNCAKNDFSDEQFRLFIREIKTK